MIDTPVIIYLFMEQTLQKRQSRTRACNKNRDKIRAEIDRIKASPCIDCGGVFPSCCMDFDHIGPKKMGIADMVSRHWPIDRILEEIRNTELVCSVCHRKRTNGRFTVPFVWCDISTIAGKQRKKRRENAEWISQIKESGVCHDCGRSFPSFCMDFDHRDRSTKIASIGRLLTCSRDTIATEMSKCDLLCSNCHRVRTRNDGSYGRNKDRLLRQTSVKAQRVEARKKMAAMYESGLSLRKVAGKFQVSPPVVARAVKLFGVGLRGISEAKTLLKGEAVHFVVISYLSGKTCREIGVILGVDAEVVRRVLEKRGISRRSPSEYHDRKPRNFTRIVDQNGVEYDSQMEAARKLGVSHVAVNGNLRGRHGPVNGHTFRYLEVKRP